jgi:hypothetical protein
MSTTAPYFFRRGKASWDPSSSDTEVPSLQKINGLLAQIVANGSSGGGGSGPENSIQLIDTVTAQVWTLTVQSGVLTLT